MACNINLKADNGENSILFKDLAKVVTDPREAVDLYYYTKTKEFIDNYKGEFDGNGEPIYTQFSEEAYINDIDYTEVELDSRADVFKKLLDSVPEMQEVIEKRLAYLRSTNDRENIKAMKELQKVLTQDNISTSIPKFLLMAKSHVFHLKRRANKLHGKEEHHIKELAGIHKAAQTYSMVEDIRADLLESPEVQKILGDEVATTGSSIAGNIQSIENVYLSKSKNFLVDEFHKRDGTWSKKDIRKALDHSSNDVKFAEQMLGYLGDSSDRVLSMAATIMMEAEHKNRRAAVDFNKNLEERLMGLEKQFGGKTEDLFKDILITLENGEVHYINPDVQFTNGKDKIADAMYNQYQKVKGNTELMEFLEFFHNTYADLNAMLPSNVNMGTRIPTVMKSSWELMEGKSVQDRYKLVVDNVSKTFKRSNLDMERGALIDGTGKPVKKVPTFYTQKFNSVDFNEFFNEHYKENIKKGMDELTAVGTAELSAEIAATKKQSELISKDLAGSLQSFYSMATNYASKSEVAHIFESTLAVVGSKRRTYTVVDSGGSKVVDIMREGKERTISGEEANTPKVLEKFLDMQLYGQKEKDLGFVEVFGAPIDTNKVLRTIGKSNGLIQLSFNVLAGLANIGNGEYNTFMESLAKEYYSTKDLAKASGFYKKNMTGILGDIGARTPNNIVNLLEEHYNILQSFHSDIKSSEATKAKRLLKTDMAYFINASGEHFLQMRGGLSMLENTKVYNKDGSDAGSLLDAHSVDKGKLKIKDNLYVKEKDGTLVKFDSRQQDRISNKIGAVLRKLHGNYSTQTANAAKQDARLALVTQFRGWAYEGIMRRYGKKRANHLLEQDVEGFYRTGGRVAWQMMKDLKSFNLSMAKENWGNLSTHEKANIRRFVTETASIALISIGGALLGHAGKMMEDDYGSDSVTDRMVLGSYELLNYEVNRLYTELFSYLNPIEAVRLLRSPVASISIVENTIKLISQTLTDPFEEYESGWRKGENKAAVSLGKLVPIYKQLSTLNADGIKDKGTFYGL